MPGTIALPVMQKRITLPGPHEQTSGLYQFREAGASHWFWEQPAFQGGCSVFGLR
jgi:hypothetical protein